MADFTKPPENLVADFTKPPENLVVMGRISGAFGIKGWVKLQPFTETPESLLAYPVWWIEGETGWTRAKGRGGGSARAGSRGPDRGM